MKAFAMSLQSMSRRRGAIGFTLIELVIVIAIVAVLTAIALPSYRNYVLRSHRSDALSTLTQDQAIFERCYAQNYNYSGTCAALPTFPQTSPQGYYSIAITGPTATTYTLTATPQNAQAADTPCATITIDQANQKTGLDSSGTAQSACWNP
jgi:type IV pilus assembly protein PilE